MTLSLITTDKQFEANEDDYRLNTDGELPAESLPFARNQRGRKLDRLAAPDLSEVTKTGLFVGELRV